MAVCSVCEQPIDYVKYLGCGSEECELKRASFIGEILDVYSRHGLSLSHEDSYGAFLIDKWREENVAWLLGAEVVSRLKNV